MQLVITADGSHTLYVPRLDEHYHSTFGAIAESMHVFIGAGFMELADRRELNILEIGFGTGLNALLTCITAADYPMTITYHTLEKHPVDDQLVESLNYASHLPPHPDPGILFRDIHDAPWNTFALIRPSFRIHKIRQDLLTFQPDFRYDLVYFDAFSPDRQPEMWNGEIFSRIYGKLNEAGIITTYCAKGAVRRMMTSAGFRVERLSGPAGKREMLRGRKI